ncbi:MAG: rhomboid family intramembrane serine protease [Candidatus Aenigmarchaeota archaeon]|nr:rhomboid family intramembrane serine protease [Candidatus Aenigmarchaeota archaeon]
MFDNELHYPFTKSLTFKIILFTAVVWIIQLIAYPVFDNIFALDPEMALSGYFYQFFTYMALHATYVQGSLGLTIYPMHIGMNMLLLAIFGYPLEQTIGKKRFIIIYILSGAGSSMFYLFFTMGIMGMTTAGLIGASGAVFGVLAAYAFKYPKTWVYFMGLIPMPAALMIVFFLVEEMFFGILGLQPGVANFGHVGGIISGLLIMIIWKLQKKEAKFDDSNFEFIWE